MAAEPLNTPRTSPWHRERVSGERQDSIAKVVVEARHYLLGTPDRPCRCDGHQGEVVQSVRPLS